MAPWTKIKHIDVEKKENCFYQIRTIIDFILFDILEYIYIYIHLDIVN